MLRHRSLFDEKLADERVLVIHVLAENRGPGRLDIHSGDMTLEFPDGRSLTPAGDSAAAAKFRGGIENTIGPASA